MVGKKSTARPAPVPKGRGRPWRHPPISRFSGADAWRDVNCALRRRTSTSSTVTALTDKWARYGPGAVSLDHTSRRCVALATFRRHRTSTALTSGHLLDGVRNRRSGIRRLIGLQMVCREFRVVGVIAADLGGA